MVSGPAAAVSPVNSLEKQILRGHSQPVESDFINRSQ